MDTALTKHWHHVDDEKAVEILDSDAQIGLEPAEVADRRIRFGPNTLSERKGQSPLGALGYRLSCRNQQLSTDLRCPPAGLDHRLYYSGVRYHRRHDAAALCKEKPWCMN